LASAVPRVCVLMECLLACIVLLVPQRVTYCHPLTTPLLPLRQHTHAVVGTRRKRLWIC
jgi:hypothetical protein